MVMERWMEGKREMEFAKCSLHYIRNENVVRFFHNSYSAPSDFL